MTNLTKEEIRRKAASLDIDRMGFARSEDLEAEAPGYDKPSQISTFLKTFIVLVKRYPTGLALAEDPAIRQYVAGRVARHLEEAAAALAYWMEEQDVMATIMSATVPDLRRQPLGYSCPAGQGSLLMRQAAVRSGLGTLGLNQMLLTREFGPRIFLSGILSDLEADPDLPLAGELCPGIEGCGRCASVCPEQAIPVRAPVGAPLHSYRGLDEVACSRSSQPYGPDRMVEHLGRIMGAGSAAEAAAAIGEQTTLHLWYNMTVLRQGAFTGCLKCEIVCPIGEDFAEIEDSASSRKYISAGIRPRIVDGFVSIENVGYAKR